METARALYNNLLTICLLIVALAAAKTTVAGQPDITNVNVSVTADKKVLVTYDLASNSVHDIFNIQVAVFSGQSIAPLLVSQLSGDVGQAIRPGIGKTVVWDARADGYVLDGDYYAEVSATMRPEVRTGSHLTQSMLFPGLGDYRLRNGSLYFLYGVGFYGSLYGAWYYNDLAKQEYIRYQQATEIDTRNELYDNTNTYALYATTLLSAAAFIYITDNTGILMKSRRLRRRDPIEPTDSKYYHRLSQQPYSGKSAATPLNTKTQYDYILAKAYLAYDEGNYTSVIDLANDCLKFPEADISKVEALRNKAEDELEAQAKIQLQYDNQIAKGDSLLTANQLDAAFEAFDAALAIKPEEVYPIMQQEIIETEKINNQYLAIITSADSYLADEDYDSAYRAYESASSIKPNESYPKNQLDLIIKRKEEIQREQEYAANVSMGDYFVSIGEYIKALESFRQALSLFPNRTELRLKISEVEQLKVETEQRALNSKYRDIIDRADKAFDNREYITAKRLYQEAQQIKPLEEYPTIRINTINEFIDRQAELERTNATGNLSEMYRNLKKSVFFVFTMDRQKRIAQGSGFFISSSGIGVSNYHVFEDAQYGEYAVVTSDGEIRDIERILYRDSEKDIIVFQVKRPPSWYNFPALAIANQMPDIGTDVFAIGNPEGLAATLSTGIVSGHRDIYLQTTTPITHGSSGGPLFNMKGEVIGITTMGLDAGSLNFAVKITEVPFRFRNQ